MMHKNENEKTYVDTAFINAIQYKVPGATLQHMGFGEFYLATPKGRVDFEGQSGRSHLVYGDAPAVELMLQHAEGC